MRRILVILLAVSILPAVSQGAAPVHAHAQILADTNGIAAGKPFTLGILFTMDAGWHIYWKYPGDAGMATKVKFTAPEGFEVGPILYPTPERFDQPGNIVAFGYENTVLLMAVVTPPKNLPADFKADFNADVSWLCCADVCIPGKDSPSLELPVSAKPQADHAELFADWEKQIPVEAGKSPDVKSVTVSFAKNNSEQSVELKVNWAGRIPEKIQFLPTDLDDYNLDGLSIQTKGDVSEINFSLRPLAGKSPAEVKFEVVIGYTNEHGERRGVTTMVTVPQWKKM